MHGWVAVLSFIGLATMARTLDRVLSQWIGTDGVDLIGVLILIWTVLAAGSVLLGAYNKNYSRYEDEDEIRRRQFWRSFAQEEATDDQ